MIPILDAVHHAVAIQPGSVPGASIKAVLAWLAGAFSDGEALFAQ